MLGGKAFIRDNYECMTSEELVSQTIAKRPLTTLQKSTKKKVTVRLKNEVEYKGKMENVDSYMNLIMTDAEELRDSKVIANYGRVIVRGNNVLFIKLENEL
jgi:small nuclear ribonucleoprotein